VKIELENQMEKWVKKKGCLPILSGLALWDFTPLLFTLFYKQLASRPKEH